MIVLGMTQGCVVLHGCIQELCLLLEKLKCGISKDWRRRKEGLEAQVVAETHLNNTPTAGLNLEGLFQPQRF